jgi:hypothetical protein
MYFQIWLLTYKNYYSPQHLLSVCTDIFLQPLKLFSIVTYKSCLTHLKDLRIIKRCVQYANEKETSHKLQILTTHSPLVTNECVEHASQLITEWQNSKPHIKLKTTWCKHASPHENAHLPEWHRIHLYMVYLRTSSATKVCGNEDWNSCLLSAYTTRRENMLLETVTDLKSGIPNTSLTAMIIYSYGIR